MGIETGIVGLRRELVTATAAAMFCLAPAIGFAANLPYCGVGESAVECHYATYAQCRAAARNTGQSCHVNPDSAASYGYGGSYASSYASLDGPVVSVASPPRAQMASASSDDIRQQCIAEAQAAYPDNGLGTATVMTQRTAVYAQCARGSRLRP
jgi:hypothetical protein